MLESTPRSTLYHIYNRRYERSCKRVFDLDFQGHAIKIEFFHYTVGFLAPENIPKRNIFEKFGRDDQNPGGVVPTPLGVRRWIFTLGICGLKPEFLKRGHFTDRIHVSQRCDYSKYRYSSVVPNLLPAGQKWPARPRPPKEF